MLALYHSSGFAYAPVTKGLLGGMVLSSVLLNLPLQSYRPWLVYSHTDILEPMNLLKFLCSRMVFLDPKDLLWASVLLYHFRMFERRYGSQKYANYLFATFISSSLLELGIVQLCEKLELSLDIMPAGPYGLLFSLFVPFFCDIPRVAITHFAGIPVTGKSVNYIIGLQMASYSRESLILAFCGIVAGLLYRDNILFLKKVRIPGVLGKLCDLTLGRLMGSSVSCEPALPMGATLELQRQQQMERLEQQMLQAQLQQPQHQRRFGFFGMQHNGGMHGNANFGNLANGVPSPPQEDQVQRLVEMGFTRDSVMRAMQTSNNDITLATNVLLQQSLQ